MDSIPVEQGSCNHICQKIGVSKIIFFCIIIQKLPVSKKIY